jgi:hypothetical protein
MNLLARLSILLLVTFALGSSGAIGADLKTDTPVLTHGGTWKLVEIKRGGKGTSYDIAVKYPEFVDEHGKPLEQLNEAVKKAALDVVQKNEADFKSYKSPIKTGRNYLNGEANVCLLNQTFASMKFSYEAYQRGDAHPRNWAQTLNYQLSPFKEITLQTLFREKSNYLTHLSKLSINELKAKLKKNTDDNFLKEGAGPEESNFKNFCLTAHNLEITFDPATVAARIFGSQTVIIHLTAIRPLIKHDSPVYTQLESPVLH